MAGLLRQVGVTVPAMLLLLGLAWWGHHTGWALPSFGELFGGGSQSKDNWCLEHSVPESICVECREELLPRSPFAWCSTHGVHDCPLENPRLAQLKDPPPITQARLDQAQRALELKERPENNRKCKKIHRRLQLASEEVLDKMGIEIVPVSEGPILETVSASGEIIFEQPSVAPIASPVSGRVWHLGDAGRLGAVVQRGDLLALVDSSEVGKAKAEFLQAFAQVELRTKLFDNLKPLLESGSIPQARIQEVETSLREAQIRLMGARQALGNLGLPIALDQIKSMATDDVTRHIQFLGVPTVLASRLDPKNTSANLFPILAPRAGVVTSAKASLGEVVDPAKTLFVVADTSRMWLILNVRNEDVKYVKVRDPRTGRPGQVVRFRPDGDTTEITGELTWKSAQVDERTRTVQFRAELPNPDGSLLANSYGMGRIILREERNAVVIPAEALHWEGDCSVVFVRDKNFLEPGAPKVFHVQNVRPGVKNGDVVEIIAGLLPGEVIATKNSAYLRAELLKNNLGVG